MKKVKEIKEEFEETPLSLALTVYFCYLVLTVFGHIRDFVRRLGFGKSSEVKEKNRQVRLFSYYENLFC